VATFQRQVVKAKISPILLAGKEFADLVGSEFAEFRPGGYELTEQGQKVLARFAALLNVHPSVGLRITGAADKIIDGDTLNRQLEDIEAQRVAEENKRRKAAWQVERDAELARRKAAVNTSQGFVEKDLMPDFPQFVPLKPPLWPSGLDAERSRPATGRPGAETAGRTTFPCPDPGRHSTQAADNCRQQHAGQSRPA